MKRLWHSLYDNDKQSGQALVESTIVFVLTLMMLSGLIEFGWAYFHYVALQDAAGEGAAYGIMYPTRPNSLGAPDPNNIEYRVRNESQSEILNWSPPTTTVTVDAPFLTPGNRITVTVTYEHELITPLLAAFVSDGTITLRSVAVQTIVSPGAPP